MLPFKLLMVMWLIQLLGTVDSNYGTLYGGMVERRVGNISLEDQDISLAVELAVDMVRDALQWSTESSPVVQQLRKARLYYSWDGITPSVIQKRVTTAEKHVQIHNLQLILGILYTFTVLWPSPDCPYTEHNIVVTRDRNMKYHIYKHTFLHVANVPKRLNSHNRICGTKALDMHYGMTSKRCSIHTEHSLWMMSQCPAGEVCAAGLHYRESHSQLVCRDCYTITLRIATYNIWNLNMLPVEGYYAQRLLRLGKLISSQNIDIFGFQEVRLDVDLEPHLTESQVTQLSHYLPDYQYVYQPAMVYMRKVLKRTEEGLAIFSRYPILSSDYILLYRNTSNEEDSHQRICLHAEVLTPHNGKIHVFVTHLSLISEAQERSVVQIWKYMSRFSGTKVLMGDLNAEPHSNTIRFLTGGIQLEGVHTSGLSDTWSLVESNQNLTGYTYSALEDYQVKRIDYIFISKPTESGHGLKLLNTTLIGNGRQCYLPCSDHLGVVATLETRLQA